MKELRFRDIRSITLRLASPQEILGWSYGEVLKPETINYRTQRPERDGLFAERIFGPSKDFECYCGKYKRIRYKGVTCDKCGVEVTRSSVRRERMGHISLAAPVSHIWFLKSPPSKISLFLDLPLPQVERVIYYSAYIITSVNETEKQKILESLEKEYKSKIKTAKTDKEKIVIAANYDAVRKEINSLKEKRVLSDVEFYNLSRKYGTAFAADLGAEPLKKILEGINLEVFKAELEKELSKAGGQQKKKIMARLKLVMLFIRNKRRPEWMFLTALPVIPPDLRPMVALDGGRYASSDVNDLYRRILNRNNRLKKLLEIKAPEIILRNEKRMLQEAVDALIDNTARKGQSQVKASTGQRRALKSLADMLRGKEGRFRQNLLGKRVDYSGRSVIVVGPHLRHFECGLPKVIALELFKPFVIKEILKQELAYNPKQASRLLENPTDKVWAILEEIIKDKYVILNRAPTLHRLGIQAFRPVLIEGMAIQIPPLVCTAFNADFDGDQMAVHVPLTDEAQKEAREILLSTMNLKKPATGEVITCPTQDIVLGVYYLTSIKERASGEGKIFYDETEARLAYEFGEINLRAKIKVKNIRNEKNDIETTVGRIIFNEVLPVDSPFQNKVFKKRDIMRLLDDIVEQYGNERTVLVMDSIKSLGFSYATQSGLSIAIDDFVTPPDKQSIIASGEAEQKEIEEAYANGLLSDSERYTKILEIWSETRDSLWEKTPKAIDKENPLSMFVDSGARGDWKQIAQMAALKGLVVNPRGETIELPITSSYKEGFSVLEYFNSTHGGRKGTADTALKTAVAGYLTRRMVDVVQDIIVREEDCGDNDGIELVKKGSREIGEDFTYRLFSRVLAEDIYEEKKAKKGAKEKILFPRGTLVNLEMAEKINKLSHITSVRVRSPLSCKTLFGVCRLCYGLDLGRSKLVDLGEAVGIVAAQSIGEPGTQLTMRTFHTGGVAAGADITQGLPRVEEVFEARVPRNEAPLALENGKVDKITKEENRFIIRIKEAKDKKSKKSKETEYIIPLNQPLKIKEGESVVRGQVLADGALNPKLLLKLQGKEAAQRYILAEIKKVYSLQGTKIHDKHIEIIIKAMFSRARIKEPGDSTFLPGDIIEKDIFLAVNRKLKAAKKKPAKARLVLLGITKTALSTYSFLSAASFQETAKVLIRAALEGREDPLRGLKENVIIGKKIPAGTGFRKEELHYIAE